MALDWPAYPLGYPELIAINSEANYGHPAWTRRWFYLDEPEIQLQLEKNRAAIGAFCGAHQTRQPFRQRHPESNGLRDYDRTMQNPAAAFLQANALSVEFSDFEEAARYALLQRLAPALQHQLMGRFQSIDMISSMMALRLRPAEPDLARLRLDCASLGSVSRIAVNSITNIMSWVEPKPADTVAFDAGVRECVGLLSMECRFKGFVIVNEIAGINAALSSRALRSVLSATLLALSDLSRGPAALLVRARAMPDGIALSIDLRPTEGRASRVQRTDYRPLKWRDVEILALAESVGLTRCSAGAQLTFPLPGTSAHTDPPGGPVVGTSR